MMIQDLSLGAEDATERAGRYLASYRINCLTLEHDYGQFQG